MVRPQGAVVIVRVRVTAVHDDTAGSRKAQTWPASNRRRRLQSSCLEIAGYRPSPHEPAVGRSALNMQQSIGKIGRIDGASVS